ncbi:HTH-type quorum sensing-dependent transcriptional regulator VjbR [Ascidiaceihabitans donghaensis]|uniref:HTH-type quorum sensing-dependent transcriptional regulator VjbR n=1 Tax=Ascidiaceihabitans donghaensis TaxID=1510460 RepID=A0A2R8BHY8_9RHOB|nr:helix-turn-helix transcriptional regulator [Ascidiaceihabitans donghaensis]SPH22739.1 HTH-type quorum sensing-dependent transcriptional regulator VjbR [Ascidiaceihabitans donghaensis]
MMLGLEPFEQMISEINARFQNTASGESNLQTAHTIVRDIGGLAVNVGGTTPAGDAAAWGMSSMSEAWLARYESEKYHLIDPFIAALVAGHAQVAVDCGTLPKIDPAYHLNHDLKAYGYGSLYGSSAGGLGSGYRTLVVFCSGETLAEVDARLGFDRLKIIHAIIAANIPNPSLSGPEDKDILRRFIVRERSLSPREHDVLSFLACGLRNDQIAFKTKIAEVTVRKHLLSIRQKLGASTREQAIAIAVRDGWITL